MKKTILAMVMAGTSCAAFAQVDSMNRTWNSSGMADTTSMGVLSNGTLSSNNSYNAYGTFNAMAPDYVSGYVLRDYPTAADIHWQQSAEWWHGYYLNNGQPMHVYYNTAGQTFMTALPVKQTLVPDEVVSKATAMWGPTLYDITAIKGSNGQDVYLVRTLENGQLNSNWIGQDGAKVIDIYRVENTDPMMNTNTSTNAAMDSDMNSMNTNTNTNTNSSINTNSTIRSKNAINDADGVMSNTSTTGGTTNDKAQADDSATGTNAGTTTTTTTTTTGTTTDGSDMNTGKSGNDKLKIKSTSPDGKKKVTKVVNGKVTTKG